MLSEFFVNFTLQGTQQWRKQRTEAGAAVAECEGLLPPKHDAGPQPDIIEHFGNADIVPQPPERCLSRKAGIMRCCQYFLKLQAIYYCLNRQIIPAWFPKRFSVPKYKLYYLISLIQK